MVLLIGDSFRSQESGGGGGGMRIRKQTGKVGGYRQINRQYRQYRRIETDRYVDKVFFLKYNTVKAHFDRRHVFID